MDTHQPSPERTQPRPWTAPVIITVIVLAMALAMAFVGWTNSRSLSLSGKLLDRQGQALSGPYAMQVRLFDVGNGDLVYETFKRVNVGSDAAFTLSFRPDVELHSPYLAILCPFSLLAGPAANTSASLPACPGLNDGRAPIGVVCAPFVVDGKMLDWYNALTGKNRVSLEETAVCDGGGTVGKALAAKYLIASGKVSEQQLQNILPRLQTADYLQPGSESDQ